MTSKAEQELFYKAVESRDYRFDGKFFTGVKTTGIYCRPICPAKPLRKNIEFFKTAHAAENEGYRPCLRCRPEVAPQSPAWIGNSALVRRAIRLISEGILFDLGEKEFAAKLGVSERHLRRLFIEEVGMTAKQISNNHRLNFSRTLITETSLPITEIALASGFNSIRRFNDAFQKKFSKKPSSVRKKIESDKLDQSISLHLSYRPPYDWDSMLQFFETHAFPGIDAVVGNTFHRLFIDEYSKKPALAIVSNIADKNRLKLTLYGCDTRSLFAVSKKVRKVFDLDSDPLLIANAFSHSKFLEGIYKENPGMRIPCAWNAFETSIATVLGQLVSTEQAQQLLGQLIQAHGTLLKHSLPTALNYHFPSPDILLKASLEKVRTTEQRKSSIREIAKLVAQNKLDLSESCDFTNLRESLIAIKGIGPWSVEYTCLRALGDTDAFPEKDLILARVLKNHPEIDAQKIRPWRSYLATYLWKEFAHVYSKKSKNNSV